jgi:hypothetical protein
VYVDSSKTLLCRSQFVAMLRLSTKLAMYLPGKLLQLLLLLLARCQPWVWTALHLLSAVHDRKMHLASHAQQCSSCLCGLWKWRQYLCILLLRFAVRGHASTRRLPPHT